MTKTQPPLSTGNAFDWRASKPDVKVFVAMTNKRKGTASKDSILRQRVYAEIKPSGIKSNAVLKSIEDLHP